MTSPARRPAVRALLATLALALLWQLLLALLSFWSREPWWETARRPGLLYAGVAVTLAGAIRQRLAGGGWRRLRTEVSAGARSVAGVAAGVFMADLIAGAVRFPASALAAPGSTVDGVVQALLLAVFGTVLATLVYAVVRAVRLAWAVWGRMRWRRLLWSLTHVQLMVSLGVAAGLATALTLADFHSRRAPSPPTGTGDAGSALGQVIDRLAVPAGSLVVSSATLIVVLVVPATLISVVVLRRATRRLEALTTATGALRAENLGARVSVTGADEVARLQEDFNAMAGDLEAAVRDLRAERDTVARLLQARRELVAAVSHELRTPVATLRAYLDSALDQPDGAAAAPPPALRQDLTVMASETERLQRLIEDLFILSQAEAGRLSLTLEAVDTGALLQLCATAAVRLAWEKGRVEVLAEAPPTPLWAQADAGRLEQVVRNLVANAVRHTPPGGVVLLTAAPTGQHVALQVKDTGEGIPAELLPRVWERFYRGASAGEQEGGAGRDRAVGAGIPATASPDAIGETGRAGLGLALVKELTEDMGGSVSVESTVGQGSVFTVRLPVAPPS